jgi:hypothetical protein
MNKPYMTLGKLPKKFNHKNLQLARYMPTLPTPPAKVDHASRLPADIGMMGNDKYGDCTVAAAAHMIQSWTTYAERGMLPLTDAQVLAAYNALSPNDQGAYMLDVLNYWRKTGIGGEKIEAFVETGIADLTQAKLAVQYFGAQYIGLSLPDINTFGPWTTPTGQPNPNNGHAVCVLDYDDTTKEMLVATWGGLMVMSYAWFLKYMDEGYACLDDISLIVASGRSPEGFDWTALQTDLAHIGDPITPTPVPVPPAPAPPPVPIISPQFAVTVVENPNYKVLLDNIAQTPTHYSPFEAVEQAGNLKLANPSESVNIISSGKWKVTLR